MAKLGSVQEPRARPAWSSVARWGLIAIGIAAVLLILLSTFGQPNLGSTILIIIWGGVESVRLAIRDHRVRLPLATIGLMLGMVSFFTSRLFLTALRSLADVSGGPIVSVGLFLSAGAGLAWLLLGSDFPYRSVVTAACAVAALLAGIAFVLLFEIGTSTTPLNVGMLEPELDRVSLPDHFVEVRENRFGDSSCVEGCPTIERTYQSPVELELAQRDVKAALQDAGFRIIKSEILQSGDVRFRAWKGNERVEAYISSNLIAQGVVLHLSLTFEGMSAEDAGEAAGAKTPEAFSDPGTF